MRVLLHVLSFSPPASPPISGAYADNIIVLLYKGKQLSQVLYVLSLNELTIFSSKSNE